MLTLKSSGREKRRFKPLRKKIRFWQSKGKASVREPKKKLTSKEEASKTKL